MNHKILPPVSVGPKWPWSSSWGAERWQQQRCWIGLWSPGRHWLENIKVLPSNIIPAFLTELTVNDFIFHFLFFLAQEEIKPLCSHACRRWTRDKNGKAFSMPWQAEIQLPTYGSSPIPRTITLTQLNSSSSVTELYAMVSITLHWK